MTLGTYKLSDDDCKKVAEQVAVMLTPKSVEEPVAKDVEVQKIQADPSTEVFHQTEAKLIAQLANPKMIQVVTKRGARLHNLTENALNALYDLGRDRKIFKQFI